jgi:hypothetical protein
MFGERQVKRAKRDGMDEAGPSAAAKTTRPPVKGSFVEDSESDGEPAPAIGRFGRRRLNLGTGGIAQQQSQVTARAWGAAR